MCALHTDARNPHTWVCVGVECVSVQNVVFCPMSAVLFLSSLSLSVALPVLSSGPSPLLSSVIRGRVRGCMRIMFVRGRWPFARPLIPAPGKRKEEGRRKEGGGTEGNHTTSMLHASADRDPTAIRPRSARARLELLRSCMLSCDLCLHVCLEPVCLPV